MMFKNKIVVAIIIGFSTVVALSSCSFGQEAFSIWDLYGGTPEATDLRLATQDGDCHGSISFSGPAEMAEQLATLGWKTISLPSEGGAFGMMGVIEGECPEPPDDFPTGGVAVVPGLSLKGEKIFEHYKKRTEQKESIKDYGWVLPLALVLLVLPMVGLLTSEPNRSAIQTT